MARRKSAVRQDDIDNEDIDSREEFEEEEFGFDEGLDDDDLDFEEDARPSLNRRAARGRRGDINSRCKLPSDWQDFDYGSNYDD